MNRKNRGFLRYSDVCDSYDHWEHFIPEVPDGWRFLRCDRKNRNHFYFEGTVPDIPDVGDFYMSVNLAVLRIAIVVRIPVSGNRKNPRLLLILRTSGNQALADIDLMTCIIYPNQFRIKKVIAIYNSVL